jgi:antitoxin component of MazEF toxin-antitoxin module
MVVPKNILGLVGPKAGSEVRLGAENDRVVIERRKPHYHLTELLAKSPTNALQPSRKDRRWLSSGPVGQEAI